MEEILHNLDEESLITRCRTELPYVMDAFSEVVRRYERYVFNLCRRYLGAEDEAEDVTQDVFMRVFHALPQFEGRSQFKTWLYRIVMNQCHNVADKRKHFVRDTDDEEGGSLFDSLLVDEHTPADNYDASEEEDCVQKTLGKMRPGESEILNLRFMGELSLEDIANTLDAKLSATKMRFYRAMEQFKKLYEKLCM
ncbi:RNA polymerase sigma factor [Thiothrix nivea]|uniref:RNA polymerase sigma factor n=1 Tax=Thiothrix nivea (strain ATCC 35100 / DSM 5205 / JP2) TaxID=870187 RepID=A0A656HAC3_THINJ|nr:sigma-70 family RNA polymerase sigma factor [Thiothrix nivea]EIJ33217.1 RNA polymerase, sigma-24 subunit, ECF subfamily [Thiothrix nivea DSM 5205]